MVNELVPEDPAETLETAEIVQTVDEVWTIEIDEMLVKSKSTPSVARASQPKPINTWFSDGSVLLNERLPPLFNEIAMFFPLLGYLKLTEST